MHIVVIQFGDTALHVTAFQGHVNVVHLLLHHNADVNMQEEVRNV